MDRNQVLTIAVTAAITVIFRELFTSLLSFAKAKTATKARRLFSKRNLSLVFDVLWFAWSVFYLVMAVYDTSPLTRKDVLVISVYVLAVFLGAGAIGWDVIRIKSERRNQEKNDMMAVMTAARDLTRARLAQQDVPDPPA